MKTRQIPYIGYFDLVNERKRRRKRRRNLFAQNTFTYKYKLAIGLSECNNIRKKLNKNHTGKVPSKAANS